MTFFQTKPDDSLPMLTQFFQLSWPASEEGTLDSYGSLKRMNQALLDREKNGKALSHLFDTDLDRWVMRYISEADARAHTGLPPNLEIGTSVVCYSHLLNGCPLDAEALQHARLIITRLDNLAALHKDVSHAMRQISEWNKLKEDVEDTYALRDHPSNALKRSLRTINHRLDQAKIGMGVVFHPTFGVQATRDLFGTLEVHVLRHFYIAAANQYGMAGGFACCPECMSTFVRTKVKHPYCSHRCRDRVGHQKSRQEKKQKNLSFLSK